MSNGMSKIFKFLVVNMLRKQLYFLLNNKLSNICRFCTSNAYNEGVTLNPKFTNAEQKKILETLNKSDKEQLSRFDISQSRIKSLQSWRNKKGPFKTLEDVLEVDGLGVKVFERLCESIVVDDGTKTENQNKLSNTTKNRRQLLIPAFNSYQADDVFTAVGFHLGPSGISWAKICKDGNRLEKWDHYDFSSYPKKMLPIDTFRLATTILSKIPIGDVYIFEATPNISIQSTKQASLMTAYNQQLELTSMLLALINTSHKHNSFLTDNVENCPNTVYYLKTNLSARLFRTFLGSERVSSTITVANLLDISANNKKVSLPCSEVKVENFLLDSYLAQSPFSKELLGQALLLIITFMDVCIYKNSVSLAALNPTRK